MSEDANGWPLPEDHGELRPDEAADHSTTEHVDDEGDEVIVVHVGSSPPADTGDGDLTGMSVEQQLIAIAALSREDLRLAIEACTPAQRRFLRARALTETDSAARHMLRKQRPNLVYSHPSDPDTMIEVADERLCGCGQKLKGFRDMREGTLLEWKHQPNFMTAYNSLLMSPVVFAANHLEALVPKAVQNMSEILDGKHGAKASDRRIVAKTLLEAAGLLQVVGTNGRANAGTQQAATKSLAERIAAERVRRQLPGASSTQAQLQEGQSQPAEGPARYLP